MKNKETSIVRGVFYKAVIAFCCALTFTAHGCKRNSDTAESSSSEAPSALPPFSTHEPFRYQAVRTIKATENSSNEILISQTKIARDGSLRREEYETKPGDKLVYLEIPAGQFVMLPSSRMFADLRDAGQSSPATLAEDQELDFSPERLLSQTVIETRYERLGPETVNGRSTTKYRVLPKIEAGGTEASSETLLWVDDTLQIPVRWETSATANAKRTRTVMELSDINLSVDAAMFVLPQNYRKVRPQELHDKIALVPNGGEAKNPSDERK